MLIYLTIKNLQEISPNISISADSDRLIQVVTNLLSNAAKFSLPNSSVDISVTEMKEMVLVVITDHGAGIPESFRSHIFGKFAQADSSDTKQKGGTGLGLNISKAIIEHSDGKIDFKTETGKGTTFFLICLKSPVIFYLA